MGLNSISRIVRSPKKKVFPERILPAVTKSEYQAFKGYAASSQDPYSAVAFTTKKG